MCCAESVCSVGEQVKAAMSPSDLGLAPLQPLSSPSASALATVSASLLSPSATTATSPTRSPSPQPTPSPAAGGAGVRMCSVNCGSSATVVCVVCKATFCDDCDSFVHEDAD